MGAFVRETQITTCDRKDEQKKDVELCLQTDGRRRYYGSHRSRVRKALTPPKQAALNDRHAWTYLERLAEMNFGRGDYHVTLTYSETTLPKTAEASKRDYDRFIARARKLYKAKGLKIDALMVMSQRTSKDGDITRLHMHVLMRGGVDRDQIEALWRAADKVGRPKVGQEASWLGAPLGFANVDRLQPDGNGLAALCAYLKKQPRDGIARRWYATCGLKKPYISSQRDDRYDVADLKAIAERNSDIPNVSWWERQYPGWTLYDDHTHALTMSMSEYSGTTIRAKLRRLTPEELEDRKKERRQAHEYNYRI